MLSHSIPQPLPYWYCHFGKNIWPVTLYHPSPLSLCSSSFCPPLHFSPSSSPCPPSSPTQAEHWQDNMQQFQSWLCKDLGQPFVSFSIHGMHLKQHGELHSTASTKTEKKKQYNHAWKGATLTHSIMLKALKCCKNINPYNDAMGIKNSGRSINLDTLNPQRNITVISPQAP